MRRQRGFTLLELTVVVSLIALSLAVMVPRYIRLKDKESVRTGATLIIEARNAIAKAYGANEDYSALNSNDAWAILPEPMRSATVGTFAPVLESGGNFFVFPTSLGGESNDAFLFFVDNPTVRECVELVPMLARHFDRIDVGNTTIYNGDGSQVSEVTSSGPCTTESSRLIVVYSF